jgi:hypothetical protein
LLTGFENKAVSDPGKSEKGLQPMRLSGYRTVARGIPNGWTFPGDVKVAGIAM